MLNLESMFSLKGKNAIVIGGSKGIGREMATGLSAAGATVIICSRKQNELDTAAKEIEELTGNAVCGMAADVSTKAGVQKIVDEVVEKFEHIDILLNCAGVNARSSALDFTEEEWDIVQNTQLKGVFLMCQAVGRQMVEKGIKGKIINIGSISSQIGLPNMVSYCSAKGGIAQLTRALAVEWAQYGICVNAMIPGYTKTTMTRPIFENPVRVAELMPRIPLKRFAECEDYRGIAVYLASPASDYVTGTVIPVDGGWLGC